VKPASETPFISVVIPTYNRADLLCESLKSVFRQEETDFEVIVVDDGSTDDLSKVVEDFRDRVNFIRQDKSGPGSARNRGAAAARGEYLAFLDSDDLWFPWTLGVFRRIIGGHRSPAILSSSLVEFSDVSGLLGIRQQPVQTESFGDYLGSSRRGYFVGAGMAVIRRGDFFEVGGFRAGFVNAEDHDLMLRMGTATGFVQLLQPTTTAWRRHPGSATTNFDRTLEGTQYLVEQEHRGAYPGGAGRARERREIIAARLRPVALQCLQSGFRHEGWQLYRDAFRWHLSQRRWRFLLGFPLMALSR
jgi:GT2 family glycosyltransferase